MVQKKKPRRAGETHAMVLSGLGCGSVAAYEVGVMKALLQGNCAHLGKEALDPAMYTGSVFGAVNAAIMASGIGGSTAETVDYLERVWLDDIGENGVYRLRGNPLPLLEPWRHTQNPLKPFSDAFNDAAFFSSDMLKRIQSFPEDGPLAWRLMELPSFTPFFDMEPLEGTLRRHVDLNRLRDSDKGLFVVTTDWQAGQPYVFSKQDVIEKGHLILQASTAIIMVFPRVEIEGRTFIGGGASLSAPLRPVIDHCPEDTEHLHIHVIYLNPPLKDIPITKMSSYFGSFGRFLTIQEVSSLQADVEIVKRNNREIEDGRTDKDMLAAIEGLPAPSPALKNAIARVKARQRNIAGKVPISLHLYRPKKYLGLFFNTIDFKRKDIEEFIATGLDDTLSHDCEAEGCVLAGRA